MTRKKRKKWEAMDVVAFVFLTFFALLVFYPFYNAVISSIMTAREYTLHPVSLFPKEISWDNYIFMFSQGMMFTGYLNTIFITCVGLVYGLSISILTGYVFSRPRFPGKALFFRLMLFTMFFSGGLVPTYLQIKEMGLINSHWSVILLLGVTPFNIIIIKNGFEQTPISIEEAAKVDGANDLTTFFQIMLPLQKPIIATFALFIAVAYWNEWFWSMLLINSQNKLTLQLVLRAIINDDVGDQGRMSAAIAETTFSQGIKMAAVIATMLPVMCIYPFVQKHFTKGIMLGAVKM